jgi:hypothetical protein
VLAIAEALMIYRTLDAAMIDTHHRRGAGTYGPIGPRSGKYGRFCSIR